MKKNLKKINRPAGNAEWVIGHDLPRGRIERLLVERDLITRTARGRQLTDLGIERAEELEN